MRKSLLMSSLAGAVMMAGCARPWSAVMRFEGGTASPEIPLIVQVRSLEGVQLHGAVLESRCIQLSVVDPPAKGIVIEVRDMKGTFIGEVRIVPGDRQVHYIPVNGQLGVLTVQAGKSCS